MNTAPGDAPRGKRVVVTGMGVVSCLGNDQASVTAALRTLQPGIRYIPEYAELGLRSQVAGVPEIDLDAQIDRKLKRFMGDAAAYAYIAMRDAIADAGLTDDQLRDPRTGVIAGSGGGSPHWQIETGDLLRNRGVRKIGPYMVPRTMCSTVSAGLATAFGIRGVSYSISSACSTSATPSARPRRAKPCSSPTTGSRPISAPGRGRRARPLPWPIAPRRRPYSMPTGSSGLATSVPILPLIERGYSRILSSCARSTRRGPIALSSRSARLTGIKRRRRHP